MKLANVLSAYEFLADCGGGIVQCLPGMFCNYAMKAILVKADIMAGELDFELVEDLG